VDLSWTDNSSNETSFKIERSTNNRTFTEIAMVGANVTTYANIGLTESTKYYYRVRASNSGGDSAYSNTVNVTTLAAVPSAPTNLTATAASSSAVSLRWTDNSTNETSFKIERSTDGLAFTEITTVGTNTNTYTDSNGLTESTTYYYRVRASNSGGDSEYSNTASATTLAAVPAAPTGLDVTVVSSSQLNLTWADNATNETGFKIERSIDGTNFTEIKTVGANTTAFSDTGLAESTKYYYRVYAYNSGGNSAYSNVVNATTPATIPAAPGNLSATAASANQVNLTWEDKSNNETEFKIERSTDDVTFTQITTVAANITSYQDKEVSESTTYYYRVRASNSAGDSAYSNTTSVTTPATVPIAPDTLIATAASSNAVNLSWADKSNNETSFKIERSGDGSNFGDVTTVSANATTYTDSNVTESTTYYYRVRATNSAGDSGYTNVASVTTPPAAPTNLIAAAVSSSEIDLAWIDNSSTETEFKIERSIDGVTFSQLPPVSANVITYADNGVNPSTAYFYRVRASNPAGDSSYSNVATATTLDLPVTNP
jgi:hypothetical protein